MNKKTFKDLPQSVQFQFLLRPIKITTLSDKSDLKVRFDLFERLNTGGVELTNQEIRGCIYRGHFNDFLEQMAATEDFNKVVIFKDSNMHDGTREEFVLRFFAFYYGYRKFEHSVIDFLNNYMQLASSKFNYSINEKIFKQTFSELAKLFPEGIRRATRLTPVNLFEAISVGAAIALKARKNLLNKNLKNWINSEEMKKYTTVATNNKNMVVGRIEFAAKKFGAKKC